MGTNLTKRQHELLSYIDSFMRTHDYAPSFREIAEHFGLTSTATVAEHIETLQRKGHLTKDPLEARSIQLVETTDIIPATAPLLGAIAAGSPIEAIETRLTIDIPQSMAGPNVFALHVRGDSMIEDGILDGDYVIVEQTTQPKNGDIVVALLEDKGATLKRFYKEKHRIRLQPANHNYAPMYSTDVAIQGKVRGVIRQFA